jgi:hypothetical protein
MINLQVGHMKNTDKTPSESWRHRFGRTKFFGMWLVFCVSLYALIFLVLAPLMFIGDWIAPHLPWISKPYVDPNPPPLVTAFYCANVIVGFLILCGLIVYIAGPDRKIPSLKRWFNIQKK